LLEPFERISDILFGLIIMLFAAGGALGRDAGQRPLRMGLAMVAVGVVLVVSTIALGG
jgi:hypothetical protein